LAGAWIITCGTDGAVNRAVSIETGQTVKVGPSVRAPGLAPGQLYDPQVGMFSLAREETTPSTAFHNHRWAALSAPPATHGDTIAVTTKNSMDTTELGTGVVRRFGPDATVPRPLGWYPPAISVEHIAWVVDGGSDGPDIWWVPKTGGRATPLAEGPGRHHHVVASEQWMAWVSPGAVVILDTATGAKTHIAAETGFSAGLSLWQDVACWETRTNANVDIVCSDGVRIEGKEHQRWPYRWGNHLLYREQDTLMLWTDTSPTE
jgi:hypothetical protein